MAKNLMENTEGQKANARGENRKQQNKWQCAQCRLPLYNSTLYSSRGPVVRRPILGQAALA